MRLDLYLVENGYFSTRTKASQSIERGEIFVNSKQITKPAFSIDGQVAIERVCPSEYVSVGGFKLEKALNCAFFCCTYLPKMIKYPNS